MKRLLLILSFIVMSYYFNDSIEIDSNIKTTKTALNVLTNNKSNDEVLKSSYDNKKTDSLEVYFANSGFGGIGFSINFTDVLKPKLFLWSDANQFDGKHSVEVEIDSYHITINKDVLKKGDTLMGKINCISKASKFIPDNESIEIKGDIFHIVDKMILVKRGKTTIFDNKF